jgi:acyl-CoA hydrolase
MDEMVFLRPVRVGDLIHAHAQVNWAGRTSMEVGVRVTSERWNEIDPPVHVASAYLVFVAVDDEGRPRPVPSVLAESDEELRRHAEAQIRRQHRLARRNEIARLRAGEG